MDRTYTIRRDRWIDGLGVEEMDLFAHELSDAEILEQLSPAEQAEVLATLGLVIENGQLVTDPALDVVAEDRRAA